MTYLRYFLYENRGVRRLCHLNWYVYMKGRTLVRPPTLHVWHAAINIGGAPRCVPTFVRLITLR